MVQATDEADARRKLANWLRTLGLAMPDPDLPTVGDALEAWYERSSAHREARSNDTARIALDRHILPALGHVLLADLDVGTLERFYARLSADGLADGTVRHLHYTLRPALRLAVRWGWIDRSPADMVERAPLKSRQVRPPAAADVGTLIAGADPTLALYIRLYAVTGARSGEIAALRWSKIDQTAATMTIDAALTAPKSGLAVKGPKTDRSRRSIGLDADTLDEIEAHRRRQLDLGMEDNPEAYLFADLRRDLSGATPHSPRLWSQRFMRLKAELNLPGIRLHDMRHFVATNLLTDGVPVSAVAAMLGHSHTSTTTDVYGLWAGRATDPALAEAQARRLSESCPPRVIHLSKRHTTKGA